MTHTTNIKKPKRLRMWIITTVIIFTILWIIGTAIGTDDTTTESEPEPTQAEQVEASEPEQEPSSPEPSSPEPSITEEPEPEPSEIKEPEPTEAGQTDDLAADLKATLLEGNAVNSFQGLNTTSPGFYISQLENVTDHTVRVHIQTELTKPEAENTARWVFNHGCTGVDIQTVVINDTTGKDRNFYADRMNPPVLCN